LEANGLSVEETVPASRKLGRDDAAALAGEASKLYVSKGKKTNLFDLKAGVSEDAIAAMLGPTGNMRSPTVRSGKTLLVGFNEEQYAEVLID
jgi:arsenate reductase-like glutaredoxin family protein